MKVVFTNRKFYYALIGYILIYILWNAYVGIKYSSISALFPISIECALLILIFTRHQYTKIATLVWIIIAILGSSALGILATIMETPDNGFREINTYDFAFKCLNVIIGIFIIDYTRRTVIQIRRESPPEIQPGSAPAHSQGLR